MAKNSLSFDLLMSLFFLTLTMVSKCGGVPVESSASVAMNQNVSSDPSLEDLMGALYHETEKIISEIGEEETGEILIGLDDFVKQAYWYVKTNLQPISFDNVYDFNFVDEHTTTRIPINHLGWTESEIEAESLKLTSFIEDMLLHFRRPDKNPECFNGLTDSQVNEWKQDYSLAFKSITEHLELVHEQSKARRSARNRIKEAWERFYEKCMKRCLKIYRRNMKKIDSGVIDHKNRTRRSTRVGCVDCDYGYTLTAIVDMLSPEKRRCVKNVCKCPFGTPAAKCEFEDGISCEQDSCVENYHIEDNSSKDKVCVMNERIACECDPVKGTAEEICFKHESSKRCKSCKAGFFLDGTNGDRICYYNKCTCENGAGWHGIECEVDKSEKCIRCNRGFELVNSKCKLIDGFEINKPYNKTDDQIACECENGVAEEICYIHESSKRCKSCNAGFYLGGMNGDKVCYHNRCTCKNGKGFDYKSIYNGSKEICEVNNTEKCASCGYGYFLVNFKCMKN